MSSAVDIADLGIIYSKMGVDFGPFKKMKRKKKRCIRRFKDFWFLFKSIVRLESLVSHYF